jgi:hypothetical protein
MKAVGFGASFDAGFPRFIMYETSPMVSKHSVFQIHIISPFRDSTVLSESRCALIKGV